MKTTFFKTAAVLGAIAAAAAFAYYRGAPDRSAQHPLLAELQRMRTETQNLLRQTSRQIDALEPACARLQETVRELDSRCREQAAGVDELQRELEEQQKVLQKYATLVEKSEGAVLPDGTSIPVETVRRQFAFEKDKHQLLTELHEQRASRHDTHDRLRQAAQQRLTQITNTLADLRHSQEQLGQQATQIAFLEQTFAVAGLSQSSLAADVRRLQHEIAAIQDQLDAQTIGLPEIIAIEQSEPADTSLLR